MSSVARRRARADWEVRRFELDDDERAADYDALFWDRIPLDERADVVWELSVELFQLANRDTSESGLPVARDQDVADVRALERLARLKR